MKFRSYSAIGILKTAMIAGLLVAGVPRAGATITAHYETDPSLCPVEDAQFPGQKCPSGLQICGVNLSSIPQCMTMRASVRRKPLRRRTHSIRPASVEAISSTVLRHRWIPQ
ncbi:MAG: hypothetical protein PHH13_04555, partial [Candidatus Peribacteraceae bacterium]|nr:hypothetical protein [Candidatus Peribacteraceae bacterium]